MTEKGTITWKSSSLKRRDSEGAVFVSNYGGQAIAIYEYSFLNLDLDTEQRYRDYGVAVEFFDEKTESSLWVWPETSEARPLLDAVKYQASKGQDFLNKLLDEDEEDDQP